MSRSAKVGDRSFKLLVEAFGSAGAALRAGRSGLSRAGIPPAAVEALCGPLDWQGARRAADAVARLGFRLLPFGDPEYPKLLAAVHDPPALLYVSGSLEPRDETAVAIVGSRGASAHGLRFARRLARELVREGVTVVSGLAQGIDAAAHRGAVEGGGRTIAVFGSGLDIVYPEWNRELAASLREHGAWLSELPLGSPPLAHHFPRRNRIISGLSLGVVVVEAAEKSGSLITASAALEQGREVFAVPGLPGTVHSRGAHRLLRSGATLVEGVEDVLEELPRARSRAPQAASRQEPPAVSDELVGIWKALDEAPLHIDELAERARLPASQTGAGLMELCLQGLAEEWPGKRYSRLNGRG
ncbi:MAG: DNA-protecting protein DprA [Deltaproteobacteria bacterium]|nr:DNA-protecting protein DprA [Deltaproteobacteria bacterium]